MQQLTVTLNLKRGLCRISTPLYLGGEYAVSYTPDGAYSLVMTEPFADSPKDGIVVWAQTDSGNTLRLTRKALHNAFVRSDSRQPGMTLSAKVFVLDESGATVADGTATVEFSPAQYIIDDAEYPTAREVLGQAHNAVSEAKHSVLMAQTSQIGAEGAKTAAEKAKSAAEDAKYAAETAAQAATNNASEAKASADTAKAAKSAAETAQTAAESAKSEAQTAAGNASEAATQAVKAETDRATTAEEEIRKRLAALVGEDAGKTIREIADAVARALISGVIDGAPEALDTLQEIADWIAKDETGSQALLAQVNGLTHLVSKKADTTAVANLVDTKVDKVDGKGLSTNDYTHAEKEKLANIKVGDGASVKFHALTPEVADTTVTLKPQDGKANWVEGTVSGTGSKLELSKFTFCGFELRHVNNMTGEDEQTIHIPDFVIPQDAYTYRIGDYDPAGFTPVFIYTKSDIQLTNDVMLRQTSLEVWVGGVDLHQAATGIPLYADVMGFYDIVDKLYSNTLTDREFVWVEGNGDSYVEISRASQSMSVQVPQGVGSARSFTLALTSDASSSVDVEWDGADEIIEAFPGASKLAVGTTVWDVKEVAPGKMLVNRASSPAQSAPLTLTAPNGRVAELTVGDDLVLEVKEM